MAIVYNTHVSYAHDTTRAYLSLLCLGLCRLVECLSASDVHNPDLWRLFAGTCTDDCMYYAIISGTNLHCSHLAALSASGANACAASPTYNTVFNCKFKDLFERKPNQIPPLSIRVQPDLRAIGFVKRNALIYSIPATPWLLKQPHINYNIHPSFKDNTSPEVYRNKFFEFCHHYKDFFWLYTVGSKMGNQVAAAVVHGSVTKTTRLPNKSSIFRAELLAISLTLAVICRTKEKNFIIFFQTPCQAWKL